MAKVKEEKTAAKAAETGKDIQSTHPARALSPFEEMDRWFENVFPSGWMRPFHREWPAWGELTPHLETRLPRIDVIDRDAEVVVRAEIPGINKDDLDVSVTDDTVTIKGEIKHEEKEEKGDYYRHEISRGAFARTIALPHTVNPEGAQAGFKDGVLELTLPKVEKAKRRTIRID